MEKRKGTRIKLNVPFELPSVEEALFSHAMIVEMLSEPGLSRSEISCLERKAKPLKVFFKLFGTYARYRKLELKMHEYALEYHELVLKEGRLLVEFG